MSEKYLTDESKPKHKLSFWQMIMKHTTLVVILLPLFALIIVYVWKDSQNSREQTALMKVANQQITINQQDLLKIIAKPLVWDIRSEMLRGNMEQVDLLISDLVKEKNFRYIHLIAPNGNVILSSNKGLEGKQIGDEIITQLLLVESPSVVELADKIIVVAAPVMGVDKRLATLVMGYRIAEIRFH